MRRIKHLREQAASRESKRGTPSKAAAFYLICIGLKGGGLLTVRVTMVGTGRTHRNRNAGAFRLLWVQQASEFVQQFP
mgnify:CR=1 FL=1